MSSSAEPQYVSIRAKLPSEIRCVYGDGMTSEYLNYFDPGERITLGSSPSLDCQCYKTSAVTSYNNGTWGIKTPSGDYNETYRHRFYNFDKFKYVFPLIRRKETGCRTCPDGCKTWFFGRFFGPGARRMQKIRSGAQF